MGTTKKANPAKTGNPADRDQSVKSGTGKDGFFAKTISYIKAAPTNAEIGVLVFMALLTNPAGSLVSYTPTKKGFSYKLDGRTAAAFCATHGLIDSNEFRQGIQMAIIANQNGALAAAKLSSGDWRSGGMSATAHTERLNWIRENVIHIGADNQRRLKTWITSTANDVMAGKKLAANKTLESVGKSLEGKKGDELSRLVDSLKGVTKKTPAKQATGKIKERPSVQDLFADLVAQTEGDFEASWRDIGVIMSGNSRRMSVLRRLEKGIAIAVATADEVVNDHNKISTSA